MDRDKKRLLLCLEDDFVWGVNDNHKNGIISYLNCLRR